MQFKKVLLAILIFWAAAVRADYQFELLASPNRSSVDSKMESQASEVLVDTSPQKADYEEGDEDEDEGGDIEFDIPVRF